MTKEEAKKLVGEFQTIREVLVNSPGLAKDLSLVSCLLLIAQILRESLVVSEEFVPGDHKWQ